MTHIIYREATEFCTIIMLIRILVYLQIMHKHLREVIILQNRVTEIRLAKFIEKLNRLNM